MFKKYFKINHNIEIKDRIYHILNIALIIILILLSMLGVMYLYQVYKYVTYEEVNTNEIQLSTGLLRNIKSTQSKTGILSYILLVDDNHDEYPVIVSSDALMIDKTKMIDMMRKAQSNIVYANNDTPINKDNLLFMKLDGEERDRYFLILPRYSDADGEMSISGLVKMSYYRNLEKKNYLSSLIYTDSPMRDMEIFNTPITAYESGKIMYDVYVYTNKDNFRNSIRQNHMYQLITNRQTTLPSGEVITLGTGVDSTYLDYYRNIYSAALNKDPIQVGFLNITVIPRVYLENTGQGYSFVWNDTYQNSYYEKIHEELKAGVPPRLKKAINTATKN